MHRLAIHFENRIAGLQPRFGGRPGRVHPADGRGVVRLVARLADLPDDDRKHHREQKTEQRTGEGHDDFVERRDVGQLVGGRLGLALDAFHRGHLRQRNVAAERDGVEDVFDVADFLFPQRGAKPDGEALHFQPAPARGEKMAQLVNANEQVEEQHHFKRNQDIMQNCHVETGK